MTREDAIKILQDVRNPRIREAICTLHPGLRESEDERIRKVIYKLMLGMREEIFTSQDEIVTKGKVLSYLEKQKENHKSVDSIPSDCVSDAKCEDRSPKHSDSDGTDIRDTPAYWKGWDDAMKQKEQKHPNGCFTCDEYKKGYESGRSNGFTAGYNKAMKEVEQKEQKPWKVGANAYFTPEQKPAEWSEEDENTINLMIAILRENHPNGLFKTNPVNTTCMSAISTDMLIKRIESLRPSWRPSKEQMDALAKAVTFFKTKWTGAKVKEQLALESLYGDLEKLM